MIGAKPLRWTCANYAAPFYEFVTAFYASSPLLKVLLETYQEVGLIRRLTVLAP